MRFNAVLFDLDGTIADSAPGIFSSMQRSLADFGIAAQPQELRKYLGPPLSEMFAAYLPPDKVADGVKTYRKYYHGGDMFNATLYDGVRQLIMALHEDGCKVCLATAKPRATAEPILRHFGLTEYFTFIGGTEEENGICNKRQVIESLIQRLGLPREEILMVGDRKDDLLAAADCGIAAVGAGYGYAPEGELEALPKLTIIRHPNELLQLAEGDFLARTAAQLNEPEMPAAPGAKKPAESWFARLKKDLGQFSALPGGRKAVVVLTLALPVLAAALLVWALFGIFGGSKATAGDTGNSAYHESLQQYSGVVLQKSEDAGTSYIDDTLFAGDSNTVRLCNFGKVDLQNTVAYVGIGIQSVIDKDCVWFEEYSEPVTMVQAVKLLQPRRIIMMFGTNNTSMDTDSFIAAYSEAYDAMQKAYPYADIIIASVPPVGSQRENASDTMKKINSFNTALIKLAEEKKCKFLNVIETLENDNGFLKSEYSESDGLHLTEAGADAFMEYVTTHSYITKDERPSVKNVPTRMKAPYMPSETEDNSQVNQTQTPTVTPAATAATTPTPTPTPTPAATETPTPTPAPTVTPTPTPTPTPQPTDDTTVEGPVDSGSTPTATPQTGDQTTPAA